MFCTKDAKDKKKNRKVQACDKKLFPCLKVMVKFTINGNEHISLMHPDSIQARGAYSKVRRLTAQFLSGLLDAKNVLQFSLSYIRPMLQFHVLDLISF